MTPSPIATASALVALSAAWPAAAAPLATDYDELEPLEAHARTSVAIVDRLRNHHLLKSKPLDDEASSAVFDKYLRFLDPKRMHFFASDVAALEEKYRHALDDALRHGDLQPAFDIFNRFRRRQLERVEHEVELLQRGVEQFDFTREESLRLDREEAAWPAHRAAAENLWRLALKGRVLGGKLADESLEEAARVLDKRVRNSLRRIRQTRSEDVFQTFINAYAQTYDRHTAYFSPRDSADFNINMSLSLEGIGAALDIDDEYTVVERLIKGGPADLGGELQARDRIVAVSQSANEPFVDVVGWRIDEVVQLIRGPKGSPVLLRVVAADAQETDARVVEIVRDVVKLEEQAASRNVLELERDGRSHRVGVVTVPTFYIDFKAQREGDPDYTSTTRDVARLIGELKRDGMDGLIVDLRGNGGGSLQEAVELAGLFVDAGPVVQVSAPRRRPDIYRDTDKTSAWQGPLAVMVNGQSASASEIFAGAIQDYGLGVVVGSRTFGKGTVQTLVPLRRGELKLTERHFYRVSGVGTERRGVEPDISFPIPEARPHEFAAEPSGAIDTPYATVPAIAFEMADRISPLLPTLRARHAERIRHDAEFTYLQARKTRIERLRQRTEVSLHEEARRAEREADDDWLLETENARLLARGEEPVATIDELDERREAEAFDEPAPEDDALLIETANIVVDLIGLSGPLTARAAPAGERRAAAGVPL